MKKLGLFTNFQFDDTLYRIYQDSLKEIIAKRTRGAQELQVELINVLPQGNDFARDNKTINTSLFESCFHTSLEYAINVQHCDVLALCFRDTYLHSLSEELFIEDNYGDTGAQLISIVDCTLAACTKRKRLRNLALFSANDVSEDNYTRERFRASGYDVTSIFHDDEIAELNRQAGLILDTSEPDKIDADALRYICGTVESAAKVNKTNGILTLGYYELCAIFAEGGLVIPVINMVDEHIKAIADAILS